MTDFLIGKFMWVIFVLVFFGAGTTLSRLAYVDFQDNQVTRFIDHEGNTVLNLQFPTVTICPIQFNDRWILQQTLLNNDLSAVFIY